MTSALKYCLVFLPPLELEDSVPFEAFFLSKLTHNNTYGMNWVNPVLPFIHSNLSKYSGMQVCPVTHSLTSTLCFIHIQSSIALNGVRLISCEN